MIDRSCIVDDGVIKRQRQNEIMKEVFRKSIHMCSAFVPLFLSLAYWPVIVLLILALLFYVVAEFARLKGKNIPFVSVITAVASRKRDEDRFVLGPVTLVVGILLCSLVWRMPYSAMGIYALSFGDGLASLSGKLFGKVKIPLTQGKTAAGSLTCFAAIFCSSFAVCHNALASLVLASCGMFIELLPLKDFDNVLIPLCLGGIAQFILG